MSLRFLLSYTIFIFYYRSLNFYRTDYWNSNSFLFLLLKISYLKIIRYYSFFLVMNMGKSVALDRKYRSILEAPMSRRNTNDIRTDCETVARVRGEGRSIFHETAIRRFLSRRALSRVPIE